MSDRDDLKRAGPGESPDEDEGFLRRWARLKEASRQGVDVEELPEEAPAQVPETADAPSGSDEAEPPGDEDMPPLDSLGPDSDYSAFMSPRVSPDLRQKALRQLFRSPKFNITDGLDDYCEDFTTWRPLGNIVTSDMKYHMERKLKEALAKESEAQEAIEADDAGEAGETRQARADAGPEAPDQTNDHSNDLEAGREPPVRGDKPNEPGNA